MQQKGSVGPLEQMQLKARQDVLRAVKLSRCYREYRSRLVSLYPLDVWSEGPYGFVIFGLKPLNKMQQGGLLLFSTLLPDKLLRVVTIDYNLYGEPKEEIVLDLIPNGLVLQPNL